jgi:Tat protein translocase TatB subunit
VLQNLNFTHIMVVLAVALVVLGPDKLPDAVRSVARVIGELRKMSNGLKEEVRGTFGEYAEPFTDLVQTITGSVASLGEVEHPGPSSTADAPVSPVAPASAPPLTSLPSLAPSLPTLGQGSGLVSRGPALPSLPALPALGAGAPAPGTFVPLPTSAARTGQSEPGPVHRVDRAPLTGVFSPGPPAGRTGNGANGGDHDAVTLPPLADLSRPEGGADGLGADAGDPAGR